MDKDSKTQLMFERMREKKKEVKVVRRIVLAIVLLILIIGFFVGRSVYQYVMIVLHPLDPESEESINVEIPIGSGRNTIAATLESKGIYKYYFPYFC